MCALLGCDSSSQAAPAAFFVVIWVFFGWLFFWCVFFTTNSVPKRNLTGKEAVGLHVPTVPAEGGEGKHGLLRTWLSSLLCPHGASFFLLPPAHLPPLALWPVWGKCWLFPGFGPMAATVGDAEVDQASGWCVTRQGWKGRGSEKGGMG